MSPELGHLLPPLIGCIPMEGEPRSAYRASETIEGFAELYGGAGVGPNAGGVRCANVGGCQVKGVGPTILAGRSTDKWHRHGACSIQDAVKEAIYSELFHLALPHGAARAVAVFDLGVTFTTEIGVEKLPGSARRALFVREPIVRLAHFMRSSFMDVDHDVAARELPRMQSAVPRLVDHICAGEGQPCLETVEVGLQKLYWRVIEQTVAMRLKRIVHGSMIPSNFGVDGRLLDFTTATAVSTLQPVVVSLGSACSQTQHKQVLDTLPDLVFYLSKFDNRCRANRPRLERVSRNVADYCNRRYESTVVLAHLDLIGLSSEEQRAISPETRRRLVRAIIRIILQGSTEGHLYYGGDEHSMPAVSGKNDLCGAMLGTIARFGCTDANTIRQVDETCAAFSRSSIEELSAAYSQSCDELANAGFDRLRLKTAHMVRAMKANGDLSGLYRRNLDGEINDVCTSGAELGAFIRNTLQRWGNLLRHDPTGAVFTQGWLTSQSLCLTAQNTLISSGRPADSSMISIGVEKASLCRRYTWLASTLVEASAAVAFD